MAEYIERSAAVKAVLRERSPANSVAQNRKLSIIQRDLLTIPAADVAPVVHGQWDDSGRYTFPGGSCVLRLRKKIRAGGYDGAQLRFRWYSVDVLSVRELSKSLCGTGLAGRVRIWRPS